MKTVETRAILAFVFLSCVQGQGIGLRETARAEARGSEHEYGKRSKVKDKAVWPAVLAVVAFEVMMGNRIVADFVLTGRHGYAQVASRAGRDPGKAL